MTPFAYHRPTDVDAAKALLAANPDAALLAGGMTLLPTLKNRLREVSDLVDLGGLSASLAGIESGADGLTVGALTRYADIAADRRVQKDYPALASLAGRIGDPQVRNRGTIGGSIANNDPAADWPAALLAFGATVETTAGSFAADDFFTGMFETALPTGELILRIRFPRPRAAGYAKWRHPASGYAVAGVCVARFADGVRVAVTGAVSQVERWMAAEQALSTDFSVAAVAGLAFRSDALMTDIHAQADYRAHLVGVMLRQAVTCALSHPTN